LEALTGRVDVPDETVTGLPHDPGEGTLDRREQLPHLVGVGTPPPGLRAAGHEQLRRVGGAVVRRREGEVLEDQRLGANLVEDPPRLLLGPRIVPKPLATCQGPERGHREVRAERQEHPGGPQRVAPEECEEPRRAGGDEDVRAVGGNVMEQEAFEVVEALVDDLGDPTVDAGQVRQ
jgi:hypothetical protein